MRNLGQVVGRNLAELREAKQQTQQEAAAFLRARGLAWTAANIASIESGRRETIDVGTLTLIAMAYDEPIGRLFDGDGEVRLGPDATVPLDVYRGWLTGQVAGVYRSSGGSTARLRIDAVSGELNATLPGLTASFQGAVGLADTSSADDQLVVEQSRLQADSDLAMRLGLEPETVYRAAQRLWEGRSLHEERDFRLAGHCDLTPNQRRTYRGHITRQLAKELEPYLPRASE